MTSLNLAFILDPLPLLKACKDSSIAMMREAAKRGHRIFAIERAALSWQNAVVSATATELHLSGNDQAWYNALEVTEGALKRFDAVLMRQDPPFDFEYIAATWLLERAHDSGVRVFNHPRAIRDHSEKIAITEFPQFIAPTLVARQRRELEQFIDQWQDTILKPLDGMGGSQIFRVRHDDPNRNVILETLTLDGQRTIMAQKYLPGITQGDKRILILGGEVIPYALARIPRAGETRGNLAAGGKGVAMPLTPREKEIAQTLAPILWQRGLLIVGLDVIDGHLTEINVTSPTCFVEISQQTDCHTTGILIDQLEKACIAPN